MHNATFWLGVASLVASSTLGAQTIPQRTPEQIKASYDAHQRDFDYLLGDWSFTADSKEHGKYNGFWTAVRIGEEAQILDEFRVVGDDGETWHVSSTIRTYNPILDQWELITVDGGSGLHNFGTAQRVGSEMHLEQKFGALGRHAR